MKKLIKLLLILVTACPLAGIAISSCSESDCSIAGRAMVNGKLYKINPQSKAEMNDTLPWLTVTALDTDSTIINKQEKVTDISLPLRYAADSTVLVFHYSATEATLKDTVVIWHQNVPYFESMDCGYTMKQTMTKVSCTTHKLDSIIIKQGNEQANTLGIENLKLYYPYN